MTNLIEINNLVKKYFTKVAVNDVSINFESGNIYGLLGPNGSGKTTLMKVLAGLHKQTKGDVVIHGDKLSYKTKANVVYMPTEDYLYPFMKVKTLIKYYDDMYNDFDIKKAEKIIKELDLKMDTKVSELSTGLKARLKVALAISRKASIYLFDEPLNGLDPISRDIIMELIIDTATPENVIIISSHLVSEVERCLDRVILIKDGEVIMNDNAEELRMTNQKSIEAIYKEVY